MKTAASFAILAILASTGTSLAAPVPVHDTHKPAAAVDADMASKGKHYALHQELGRQPGWGHPSAQGEHAMSGAASFDPSAMRRATAEDNSHLNEDDRSSTLESSGQAIGERDASESPTQPFKQNSSTGLGYNSSSENAKASRFRTQGFEGDQYASLDGNKSNQNIHLKPGQKMSTGDHLVRRSARGSDDDDAVTDSLDTANVKTEKSDRKAKSRTPPKSAQSENKPKPKSDTRPKSDEKPKSKPDNQAKAESKSKQSSTSSKDPKSHSSGQTLAAVDPNSAQLHDGVIMPVGGTSSAAGKTLGNPNSGAIGFLGKTADDALQPDVDQGSKVLPRRANLKSEDGDVPESAGSALAQRDETETDEAGQDGGLKRRDVGTDASSSKPLNAPDQPVDDDQYTASDIDESHMRRALGGDLPLVGGVVKPVTSNDGAVFRLTNPLLGTTSGLIGSAGNIVTSPSSGSKKGLVNSQALGISVEQAPSALLKPLDLDHLTSSSVKLNSDSAEKDAQHDTYRTSSQTTNDTGLRKTSKGANNLAYSGSGTDHRVDGHPLDPLALGAMRMADNTKQGNKTAKLLSPDANGSHPLMNQSTNHLVNSASGPADPLVDSALPDSGNKGSLLTINSQNANAKLVQTPGKSTKVVEADSNSTTGSKNKSDNINAIVSTPQQANHGDVQGSSAGSSDDKNKATLQPGNDKVIKQEVVAQAGFSSQAPDPSASPSTAFSSPTPVITSSTAYPSSSSSNNPPSSSSLQAQQAQYVAPSAAPSSPSSHTQPPILQAAIHSGSVNVDKNKSPTSISLTSAVGVAIPSASALNKVLAKPRQATITYGQKGEHVVACDGKQHQRDDIVDECISMDLLDYRPNQTEACPVDMQHDIYYGLSTNDLEGQAAKAVMQYVRLCMAASAM
ncbi:hypothetical protein IAU60_002704 [Kwoniella sp. DSM 27419]